MNRVQRFQHPAQDIFDGKKLSGRGVLVISKVKSNLKRKIEARALEIPYLSTVSAALAGWTV